MLRFGIAMRSHFLDAWRLDLPEGLRWIEVDFAEMLDGCVRKSDRPRPAEWKVCRSLFLALRRHESGCDRAHFSQFRSRVKAGRLLSEPALEGIQKQRRQRML
jgi:hypothetical protein